MQKLLMGLLVCPVCKGKLEHKPKLNELWCYADELAFPIIEDIPRLIEEDARLLSLDEKLDR